MDTNYNWNNVTFSGRCGQSLNLAVNDIARCFAYFISGSYANCHPNNYANGNSNAETYSNSYPDNNSHTNRTQFNTYPNSKPNHNPKSNGNPYNSRVFSGTGSSNCHAIANVVSFQLQEGPN